MKMKHRDQKKKSKNDIYKHNAHTHFFNLGVWAIQWRKYILTQIMLD